MSKSFLHHVFSGLVERPKFIKSTIFSLSLLVMAGCGSKNQEQGWSQEAPELPVAEVLQESVVVEKEYTASIEGIANVEIRPQVSGYLSKIFIDEGDYVKAGQPLFKIEDFVYQEQLRNAQAVLVTAQANLSNAKIQLDRKKELVSSRVVSDFQVQEAQAAYNAAKGAVSQAESAVESARINLNFTTIKAPVSGYVSRFNYRLGSLLAPTNVEAITMLSDIREVYTYFSMSENDFTDFQETYSGHSMDEKLKNAPAVSLLIANGSKYELSGRIDAVDGQFNRNTGSITLRAKFNNPKLTLRSGNTGKVVLEHQYKDAVLLPIAATMSIQDRLFAFTVDSENKAVQVPIQVAGKSGTNFIVSGGVKPGDRYIVTGFERLQTGTIIKEQKQAESIAQQ